MSAEMVESRTPVPENLTGTERSLWRSAWIGVSGPSLEGLGGILGIVCVCVCSAIVGDYTLRYLVSN